MSFRRAEDHTYIAQLLGRMVRTPLARRIERDATLNDVHLFLPYFDAEAVEAVAEDLKNVETAPPAETGSANDLVTLERRADAAGIFTAMGGLVTYRVNAARAQSHLRRLMGLARRLNRTDIDPEAPGQVRKQVLDWLDTEVAGLKSAADFAERAERMTSVRVKTIAGRLGGFDDGRASAPMGGYAVAASAVDIDRMFEAAGQRLGEGGATGLHRLYWQAHAEREPVDAKVELILLTNDAAAASRLEASAAAAFNALYDQHKHAIGQLKEKERQRIQRLRRATAEPVEEEWTLPERIDFRRPKMAPLYERHLYLETDGSFRAELETWERELIAQELQNPAVVGWLRNLPRKAWSLEIPYESGGALKPMFPDLVIVRAGVGGVPNDYRFDILEPHNPSLADNFEKAKGLGKFAGKHGHLFDRIELIRKKPSAGGGTFLRLDLNSEAVRNAVLLVTGNPQLDAVFDAHAKG